MSDAHGRLVFQEGVLLRALRQGQWVVLDELNLAPTDVLEALNRLLDDNHELFVPELNTTVTPHPRFMLFATQNPPGANTASICICAENYHYAMHATHVMSMSVYLYQYDMADTIDMRRRVCGSKDAQSCVSVPLFGAARGRHPRHRAGHHPCHQGCGGSKLRSENGCSHARTATTATGGCFVCVLGVFGVCVVMDSIPSYAGYSTCMHRTTFR